MMEMILFDISKCRWLVGVGESDQSSLCAQCVAKDPMLLHANSEDPDQTGRMPRLI